jgi:hypothetical protein
MELSEPGKTVRLSDAADGGCEVWGTFYAAGHECETDRKTHHWLGAALLAFETHRLALSGQTTDPMSAEGRALGYGESFGPLQLLEAKALHHMLEQLSSEDNLHIAGPAHDAVIYNRMTGLPLARLQLTSGDAMLTMLPAGTQALCENEISVALPVPAGRRWRPAQYDLLARELAAVGAALGQAAESAKGLVALARITRAKARIAAETRRDLARFERLLQQTAVMDEAATDADSLWLSEARAEMRALAPKIRQNLPPQEYRALTAAVRERLASLAREATQEARRQRRTGSLLSAARACLSAWLTRAPSVKAPSPVARQHEVPAWPGARALRLKAEPTPPKRRKK